MRESGASYKQIATELGEDTGKCCALVSGKNCRPYLAQMYLNREVRGKPRNGWKWILERTPKPTAPYPKVVEVPEKITGYRDITDFLAQFPPVPKEHPALEFFRVDYVPLHGSHLTSGADNRIMGAYTTDMYEGMLSETIMIDGHKGLRINAYFSRPLGPGPFPGVVLVHHRPGWDEWYKEATRRFAHHGYLAICTNLYFSFGHGTPEEVASKMRAAGGIPDDDVVADISNAAAYMKSMPICNGRVAGFGSCSGGRHVFLVACRTKVLDAAIDCWGGSVVMKKEDLTPNAPVSPLDYAGDLSCPLLGLFGEEDRNPGPEQVAQIEAELKRRGKTYEFHSYPNAGHGFFYYHTPGYRQEQAVDGWNKIWSFLERNLGKPPS